VIKTKEEKKLEREERNRKKKRQQECRTLVALNGNHQPSRADSDSDAESSGDELLAGILPKVKPRPIKIALLCLPPSDYRIDRCARTTQLLEPACEDEKVCWNEEGLNPCEDRSITDLEDAAGHYGVLKSSKRSSTAAVKHSYNKAKQHYHNIAVTHHPDKTNDEAKIALYQKEKWAYDYDQSVTAFKVLGLANDEGHFEKRVEYDLSGEALRLKFRTSFVARYGDAKLFSERAKEITTALERAKIFKQGSATKIINKELPVMERICKHWCKTGHQINLVRVLVSEALESKIDKSDISRFIRANVYNSKEAPWNGVATGDKRFLSINQTVFRIEVAWRAGRLARAVKPQDAAERFSKTVQPGARGRKVIDPTRVLEKELYKWCRAKWEDDRHVTRAIMLRHAMCINPGFLGGVGSQGHFSKLKNWFYYGWKKRFKLSTRKISSCGQKLPRDWQLKVANIIARISKGQMPHQRMDGSFCPGADDDHVINSDQVPVWIESHSST